jgi:hypothetical protein
MMIKLGNSSKPLSFEKELSNCYYCNQPGHFATQCAVKRADLQEARGADKM